ncbi:unnamed protein product [marine sediment metagenome]|uniref:DUF4031 domain-containing protein n=1 Tax=marine sediment metagenome TaxID=412755 RepID=X1GIM0_9ZZZZ
MIYTDKVHLVGDTLQELHDFAKFIGLKREWFQDHPRHPHYDITTSRMLKKILAHKIIRISSKQLLKKLSES